jgi:aminoglycoside phosphotransferase (APT) family kinase protein
VNHMARAITGEAGANYTIHEYAGGMHTQNFFIVATSPDNGITKFVARFYPTGDGGSRHCENEIAVLNYLQDGPLPVPKVLWSDAKAAIGLCPSVALTLMPGAHVERPTAGHWVQAAKLISVLHQLNFDPLPHESLDGYPNSGHSLKIIHGDLSLSNVLFCAGKVSAILDWSRATRGPVVVDLASLWLDAALFGSFEAASSVLTSYLDATGLDATSEPVLALPAAVALLLAASAPKVPGIIAASHTMGVMVDAAAVLVRLKQLQSHRRLGTLSSLLYC